MTDAQRKTLDRVSTNLKKYVLRRIRMTLCSLPGSLHLTADYSDFLVTCRGNEYKVHKSIVCSRSEFFSNAERFRTHELGFGLIDDPAYG